MKSKRTSQKVIIARKLLENQKKGMYPDQKSKEWSDARFDSLTASDCATALDCNMYETSLELLTRKISSDIGAASIRSKSNMSWGNKYEPIARTFYENMVNAKVHEIGLVKHAVYSWLGASPDGLILNGKLLEIKCPVHRKVTGDIPYYYWIQVQIQLEVCDLDECDFLDCKFIECSKEQYDLVSDSNMKGIIQKMPEEGRVSSTVMEILQEVVSDEPVKYWHLQYYSLQTIKRDKKWFAKNINHLNIFWNKVIHYRKNGQKKLHEDTKLSACRARKRSALESEPVLSNTGWRSSKRRSNVLQEDPKDILPDAGRVLRSSTKKQKIFSEKSESESESDSDDDEALPSETSELIDWNKWVSATKTRNYVIEDPLIDWLEYHGNHHMNFTENESPDPLAFQPGELQTPMFDPTDQNQRANYDVGTHFESDFRNSRLFTDFLKENGTKFEKYVMKELFNRFPDNILSVANQYQARSARKFKETVKAMNRGVPIIYQGVLHNHKNSTYGMPDLIVRSDWLNKIFSEPVISESSEKERARSLRLTRNLVTHSSEDSGIPESWHYRIVDIKFTTLSLRADGKHMLKNNSVEAMKSQLYIYNMALSNIQGYNSPKAYIIGRKWHYSKCGVIHSGDGWFDKAGHVNFKNVDRHIRKKTRDALLWIHKVRRHGHKFKLNPPSCPELYPNMCNTLDGPWRRVKKKIADEIYEITSLWQCGPKNRVNAHARGILGWNDPRCCAEHLGVTGNRITSTLQQIIDVNQTSELEYLLTRESLRESNEDEGNTFDQEDLKVIREDTEIIIPDKIGCNLLRKWSKLKYIHNRKKYTTFVVDFETITDLCMDDSLGSSYVFMIGLGYAEIVKKKGKTEKVWKYKCFYTNGLTNSEEKNLFLDFHKFLYQIMGSSKDTKYPVLLHWSHAEKTFYDSAWGRHGGDVIKAGYKKIDTWQDVLKIFRSEPITIRGSLNFSLKSIAKAFHKHGFIETTWDSDSDVCDGMSAMIQSYASFKYAQENNIADIMRIPIMRDVMHYNEIDVKVIYEIVDYLGRHR